MLSQPIYIERAAASFRQVDYCFYFQEPDYKICIPNANMRRRMSRMVRMGVAAGMECLEGTTTPVDAILTATGYGCLTDTENFMLSILDTDEQQPSPSSFIQSTFNTIGAQIAILTGNHQYNNTYVHRGFSFESALLDAALLIGDGEAGKILVGATDEMTSTLNRVLGRMGNWNHYPPGEGAAFFLLSATMPEEKPAVAIADIELVTGDYTKEELKKLASAFIKKNELERIALIWPEDYKPFCGEYPTAISFALWVASRPQNWAEDEKAVVLCHSFLRNHSFTLLKLMS